MSSDARARKSNVVKLSAWRRRPFWQPERWRPWFAWRPVRVDGVFVWLRWIAWRKVRRTYPSHDLLGEFHPWQIEYTLNPPREIRGPHDGPGRAASPGRYGNRSTASRA